jgi:hypothetical protein
MVQGLWAVRSGRFAGWRIGDNLYDASGENVGYFDGNIAISVSTGRYIGEIYQDDWIGKRAGISRPIYGIRGRTSGISYVRYADRVGLALGGWSDPDF